MFLLSLLLSFMFLFLVSFSVIFTPFSQVCLYFLQIRVFHDRLSVVLQKQDCGCRAAVCEYQCGLLQR